MKQVLVAAFAAISLVVGAGIAHAEEPTKLKIAGILSAGKEAPWETSFVNSMDRVIAAKPHGLEIEVNYTENVYDNAEQVFRTYAETGEYDILFGDTAYVDAIDKLKDEFPDIMFVMSGSGNQGLGGNAYWVFIHAHEPAYVMGQLAGKLTKSNVVGAISTFPAEDTNDQINAFFAGAKDVNPQVKQKITFIQSWFDPTKSNEATSAQIAAGADMIYQMSSAFEVCEQSGIGCFGNYVDMSKVAPKSIVASTVVKWDPHINWIVDEWWKVKTTGGKFDAPTEPRWFTWQEDSGELVINPSWEAKLPDGVKKLVAEGTEAIKTGQKKIELNIDEPKSD
ncbi:BMP family ABC transporter substrate-binding protein [Pseudaminobacter sp. 19-2017]|uniref:BMP family ABC transporter substrate-binding protein n=1 Tax=Pseudaminobacter soli (ex Zhang et al. 2022) TaxID=2831468 RepID=A0A942E1S0_9HYPH|nr:BMP family ABC transporter substrate-binding protein [Pseudaminobacter soli]MBS3652254.1 BMP family ABC transporter substrate-binding protein [Pseudaminobacter soli]